MYFCFGTVANLKKMKTIKLDPEKTRQHTKYQIDYIRQHVSAIPKGEGVSVNDFIEMVMDEHGVKLSRPYLIKLVRENEWLVWIGKKPYLMNPEAE